MTLDLIPGEFPYIQYDENFITFFLSSIVWWEVWIAENLSEKLQLDIYTEEPVSECAPPLRNQRREGAHSPAGEGGWVPILTTGEKA